MPRTVRTLSLTLALTALFVCGQVAAQARPDPINTWKTSEGLGKEFRDMGAAIAQIQTVKRVPFFNLSGQERMARFSDYGTSLRERNFKGVAQSVGQDFSSGLIKDLGVVFMSDILGRVARGEDMGKAVTETVKGMTSKEFIFGNLVGGTLGAALGTAIPMPVLPGLAGQMMGTFPMLAGAMLGTRIGVNLVQGKAAFHGINPLDFSAQVVGSTVGMVLGQMIPVPTLGPIVGGALGGQMGLKVAAWLREKMGRIRGPQITAGETTTVAAAPQAPASAPQAPQDSSSLAGLAPTELKALSDTHYREYLKAAASGDPLAAAQSLASYKQAREALAAQK